MPLGNRGAVETWDLSRNVFHNTAALTRTLSKINKRTKVQGNNNPSDSIRGIVCESSGHADLKKKWQARGNDQWIDPFEFQNEFRNQIKLDLLYSWGVCVCIVLFSVLLSKTGLRPGRVYRYPCSSSNGLPGKYGGDSSVGWKCLPWESRPADSWLRRREIFVWKPGNGVVVLCVPSTAWHVALTLIFCL